MTELLKDQVAIITGATGTGIGRGISLTLAEAGANIVVCGRHPEGGRELIEKIKALGRKTLLVKTDISDSSQVKELISKVLNEFGRIDILINNAGINLPSYVKDMTDTKWQSVINTCLSGVFYCSREVLPPMISQNYRKIVNISSYVGYSVRKGMAPYCSAKAGLIAFTKTLALEVAEHNINVNGIAPGFVYHERLKGILTEEEKNKIVEEIPLKRAGELRDLAGPTLLLVSDMGSYITGETILVTGGLCMD